MNVNYNQLLANLAGIVGITSAGLLITLPSEAKEAVNPHPSVFSEAPYSRSQRIESNTQNAPTEPVTEAAKGAIPSRNLVAQQTKQKVNPRPSIFNEPPYNRGGSAAPTPTTPEVVPTPTTPETAPRTPRNVKPSTTVPTDTKPAAGTTDNQGKNLVALTESNASFTTLAKALKAAGLTETLQGKDNFTIFAPTDAAFAKLPKDAVRDLLKPENKEVLVKLLTYHVVSGKVLSKDLKSGEVKSIEGGAINVKVDPAAGVTVNEAKVTQADIQGSNGVIHAIDQVILPPDL
ncbi:fasciclin domain-containing protein [Calothrix sp. PCC 7507]|uniref:fasciclin domain-containing protein n=1 Tax=Calothrix sp. PCC 7507 TaxID=99598 RepID=UPI00029F3D32|nr:fasciclin domain-containing protein [Calothrix sp. PCC 7507]AFY36016.1 beta-Ig-H3/fasciclin [Calothrix sp. PCC 7507]